MNVAFSPIQGNVLVCCGEPLSCLMMVKKYLLLFIAAALTACGAQAPSDSETDEQNMIFGNSDKENYVIFSPMEGVLLNNGVPMANTTIVRRLRWNGNDDGLVEKFLTDDEGRFSLPLYEKQLSLNFLTTFVGKADLQVETPEGLEFIWTSSKTSAELFAESDGEMYDLVCDLSAEEIGVPMSPVAILTKCKWRNMPK